MLADNRRHIIKDLADFQQGFLHLRGQLRQLTQLGCAIEVADEGGEVVSGEILLLRLAQLRGVQVGAWRGVKQPGIYLQ